MRERIAKLKEKFKNQKGFTLIELMGVLAILAVILLIAVPAIGNIIDRAGTSADAANVELVENAAEIAYISQEIGGGVAPTYTAVGLEAAGFLKIDGPAAADFDAKYVLERTGNSGAYSAELK